MEYQGLRSGAEEESALKATTQKLREETGELSRQNAALEALLERRRSMVNELRAKIAEMDKQNAQINREVAAILGQSE